MSDPHDELVMRARPRRLRRPQAEASARRVRSAVGRLSRSSAAPARKRFVWSAPAALQRSIVKARFVANRGAGSWRAHGRYLAREGAQEPGRPGRGFDADREGIDLPGTLSSWQRAGDRRLWKLIVSPENGHRMDLRQHARDLVAAMEGDLGTRLEWVAIDHHDTAQPHLHVIVRGRDSDGRTLFLPRHYVSHGIRERSQHAATQTLGLRGPRDHALALERAVDARHYGLLDAALDRRKSAERTVSFDDPVPGSVERRELRVAMIRRLQFLEPLGLAERTGKRTWRLSADHGPALRQMQLARDLQRSAVSRDGRRLVDPSARQRLSVLEPGTIVRGRWAGLARDEARDAPYWVVEGTDGLTHFVPEHPIMALSRSEDRVQQGELVTLTGRSRESEGLVVSWVRVARHGTLEHPRRASGDWTELDREALRQIIASGDASLAGFGAPGGFAARYREAVRARIDGLERAGLLPRRDASSRSVELPAGAIREAAERALARLPRDIDSDFAMPRWARELDDGPFTRASSQPGRLIRGHVLGHAEDAEKTRHVVLSTGLGLTAVPWRGAPFAVGHDVRGQSRLDPELDRQRQRVVVWRLEDLERARERDRGHQR